MDYKQIRTSNLRKIGYQCYADYLRSKQWKKIRQRVLKNYNNMCCICTSNAEMVHHICYDMDVLKGKCLHNLVPMCLSCHKRVKHGVFIEFPCSSKHKIKKSLLLLKDNYALKINKDQIKKIKTKTDVCEMLKKIEKDVNKEDPLVIKIFQELKKTKFRIQKIKNRKLYYFYKSLSFNNKYHKDKINKLYLKDSKKNLTLIYAYSS